MESRKGKKRGGEERRTGVLSNADDESLGGGGGAECVCVTGVHSSLFFPIHKAPPPLSSPPLLSLCVTAGVGNVKGRTKSSPLSSPESPDASDATPPSHAEQWDKSSELSHSLAHYWDTDAIVLLQILIVFF